MTCKCSLPTARGEGGPGLEHDEKALRAAAVVVFSVTYWWSWCACSRLWYSVFQRYERELCFATVDEFQEH